MAWLLLNIHAMVTGARHIKSVSYLLKVFLSAFAVILFSPVFADAFPQVVSVKAGVQKDFDRLVIELSEKAKFRVKQDGSLVYLEIDGAASKNLELPSTGLLKVTALKERNENGHTFTLLTISVEKGAKVARSSKADPFGIVLDVHPPYSKEPKNAKQMKEVQPSPEEQTRSANAVLAALNKRLSEKSPNNNEIPFNDGWRWAYRKKAVSVLRDEINKDDSVQLRVMADELGIPSGEREYVLKAAGEKAAALKAGGDKNGAEAVNAVINFFVKGNDPSGLERILRSEKTPPFGNLIRYLLGDYYEKRGFYPEATGYYSLLERDKKETLARSAAIYGKGSILFFNGRLDDAKAEFKKAERPGFPEPSLWLANTLLVKGEIDEAWGIYNSNKAQAGLLDPITRMSLGEINLIKKNFDEARFIFDSLRLKYPKDQMMAVMFALRSGDAYRAEGKKDDAARIYSKAKEKLNGEGWAMAALSLADLLFENGDNDSVKKAERLYQSVADADYIGSEAAAFNLISAYVKLDKYEDALSRIEGFPMRYPTSPLRQDLQRTKSNLVYKWMDSLYNAGDNYGVIKVNSVYGASIPFGKKAETYLKVGKSMLAVGLATEGVSDLNNSIKLGKDDVVEEAMMTLGKVYFSQGDMEATERLFKAFKTRFPKSRYAAEVEKILLKVSFIKGDYRRAADSRQDDPEALMLRAISFVKLSNHNEAGQAYEKAAKIFESKGDKERAKAAYMGMADSNFVLGKYPKAIECYKKALENIKEEKGQDRAWALYRTAQSYSKLNKTAEEREVLKELKETGDEFGNWAVPIFKEARNL